MWLRPSNTVQINSLLDHFPKRTHFPELLDTPAQLLNCIVNFLLGGEPAYSDPQRRMRVFLVHAQRSQHIRRFQGRRGAGRTRRHCHFFYSHYKRFAFHIAERYVEVSVVSFVLIK